MIHRALNLKSYLAIGSRVDGDKLKYLLHVVALLYFLDQFVFKSLIVSSIRPKQIVAFANLVWLNRTTRWTLSQRINFELF